MQKMLLFVETGELLRAWIVLHDVSLVLESKKLTSLSFQSPPLSLTTPKGSTWTYQTPTVRMDKRLCHLPSIHANATSFSTSPLCCMPCGKATPSTPGIS